MRARHSSRTLTNAATELAFAIAAFGCGVFDAPVWLTGLAAIGMLAYWTWTRRVVMNRLRGASWVMVSAVAVIAIISIQAGAYWLGLASGGHL